MNPYVPRKIDLPTPLPLVPGADLSELDEAKIFAAPDDPADWPLWREQLTRWRSEARDRIAYDGSHYDSIPLDCFSICLAWLWDETLHDHRRGVFTVDAFLDAADRDFGGFDGVVLWHAYPVIGIDSRNQFDFYHEVRDLPAVVDAFQRRGVRVFVDYNPWDSLPAGPHAEELAKLVERLGVDGVFLDTLKESDLRSALPERVVLEGESRVPLARIADHAMSWAQWFADSAVPGVLRAKWFERRHMMHHTRRWHRDHLEELHSAWLNGCGMLVWENVFGVWVGWNERDRSVLRTMRRVQKAYPEWLRSESWTPLSGTGERVFASRWIHNDIPLWTVVNRHASADYDGPWLITEDLPGRHWIDPAAGTELTVTPLGGGFVEIGGHIAAGGVAAVFPSPQPLAVERIELGEPAFPARMAVRTPTPLVRKASVPQGMVAVEGGRFELVVEYRQRETGLYGEAPYVDEWKPLPPRLHGRATMRRTVDIGRFAIDMHEVTNAQYREFDPHHAGDDSAPATGVDIDDARAYAKWAGLRLPTEDEWQIAAGLGLISRLSPTVWNLTESEHSDGRTRFCILKGGSDFRAEGSDWYFDGGPQSPATSAKLLLLGAGLTRSPSIGFRCAADLSSLE